MEVALGLLMGLFEAKLAGGQDTDSIKYNIGPKPKIPINEAILQTMNAIQSHPEFDGLRNKQGLFYQSWRDVEAEFVRWDSEDEHRDMRWFNKLVQNYYAERSGYESDEDDTGN